MEGDLTLYGGTLAALIRPLTRVNRIRTGEEGTGLPRSKMEQSCTLK